jgi:hypothetical protein
VQPVLAINVVDPLARKGFRFKGKATVYTEGPEFAAFVAFYIQQGVREAARRIRSIVLVKVELALPLISPAYDFGATEEEVRAQWKAYMASLEQAQQ